MSWGPPKAGVGAQAASRPLTRPGPGTSPATAGSRRSGGPPSPRRHRPVPRGSSRPRSASRDLRGLPWAPTSSGSSAQTCLEVLRTTQPGALYNLGSGTWPPSPPLAASAVTAPLPRFSAAHKPALSFCPPSLLLHSTLPLQIPPAEIRGNSSSPSSPLIGPTRGDLSSRTLAGRWDTRGRGGEACARRARRRLCPPLARTRRAPVA